MKILDQILNNQTFKHKGDLTIEGHVGDGAKIELEEGSLTINGNVGAGAQINVRISEELRKKSSINNIFSLSGNNKISFGSGGVYTGLVYKNGALVSMGGYKSANIRMNNTYIGNVNINNRIFSNDKVTDCGNNTYEITVAASTDSEDLSNLDLSNFFSSYSNRLNRSNIKNSAGIATATIDGVVYKGTLIRVVGKNVTVDNQNVSNSNSTSSNAPDDSPKGPFKVCIKGTVFDNVTIRSDAAIETQNIGKNCIISSDYEGLDAENIGQGTRVNVRNKINAQHVDADCSLKSD